MCNPRAKITYGVVRKLRSSHNFLLKTAILSHTEHFISIMVQQPLADILAVVSFACQRGLLFRTIFVTLLSKIVTYDTSTPCL